MLAMSREAVRARSSGDGGFLRPPVVIWRPSAGAEQTPRFECVRVCGGRSEAFGHPGPSCLTRWGLPQQVAVGGRPS